MKSKSQKGSGALLQKSKTSKHSRKPIATAVSMALQPTAVKVAPVTQQESNATATYTERLQEQLVDDAIKPETKATSGKETKASKAGINVEDDDPLIDMAYMTKHSGLSSKWFYALIKAGKFPKPLKFGRCSRWYKSDYDNFVKAREAQRKNKSWKLQE